MESRDSCLIIMVNTSPVMSLIPVFLPEMLMLVEARLRSVGLARTIWSLEREAREARREKLKVLYPELSYNTELVRDLLGRAGLLSTISSFSRQRLEQDIHVPDQLETFQQVNYSHRVVTLNHFWGE